MILLFVSTLALAAVVVFLFNQQVRAVVLVLKLVSSVWDVITLPVYFLIDQPWKIQISSKTRFVEKRREANNNYTFWQRNTIDSNEISDEHRLLRQLVGKASHLSDLLQVAKLHKAKKCLGKRRVQRKRVGDEVKFELSDYEWLDYAEVLDRIEALRRVFDQKLFLKRGDRVLMIVGCCMEWLVTFVALQSLGVEVVILLYGPDLKTITSIMNRTEIEIVFTQANLVGSLNEMRPTIPKVKKLIAFQNPYEEPLAERLTSQYDLFEYDQLLDEGRSLLKNEFNKNLEFSSDDIAIIIFTSGSTGLPKGVLIPHSSIIEAVRRYLNRVVIDGDLSNEDTFLAYLESHTMEVIQELLCFVSGVKIAYGSPACLLTGSPRLASGCVGDLATSKASFWIAMPQHLEGVRREIEASLRDRSPLHAAAYDFAFEYRQKWSKRGYRCRMLDAMFFSSIKSRYSDQLRLIFTGGAPLRKETNAFIKHYLDTKLIHVYASTEVVAISLAIYDQFDAEFTTILHDGVRLRLEPWLEAGYSPSDRPNPRGEIVVSDALSVGYFKNPEETVKAYCEENGIRWWRTGDIGEMNEYGQLSIIDRRKDLVKLQRGQYIALGKSEAILKCCKFVENIVIHANGLSDYLTAVVLPNRAAIRRLAESMRKSTNELSELCEDADIRKAVVDELNRVGSQNFLLPVEVPQKVIIVSETWTPQNGFLTELMKIKRRHIYEFYKKSIDAMYAAK